MAQLGSAPWTQGITEGTAGLLEAEDGTSNEVRVAISSQQRTVRAPCTLRPTKFLGLLALAVAAAAVLLLLSRKAVLDGAPSSADVDGVVSRITAKQALKEALLDIMGGGAEATASTQGPTHATTPKPNPKPAAKKKPHFAKLPVEEDLRGVDLESELADLVSPAPGEEASDDDDASNKTRKDKEADRAQADKEQASHKAKEMSADPSVEAPPTCTRDAPKVEAHDKVTSCCFASSSPHGDPNFCGNCFPGAVAEEGSSCAASPETCIGCGGQATWCEEGGGPPSLPVLPPTPQCSSIEENCIDTKCCKVSGLKCYSKDQNFAACMDICTPEKNGGWDCQILKSGMSVETEPLGYVSLFCWSVMRVVGYEPQLLRAQYAAGASIFGCDAWTVLSEEKTWIAKRPEKVMTEALPEAAKKEKSKLGGNGKDATTSWVNTNTFLLAWDTIGKAGVYKAHDWTTKVDPDAVFLPSRLREFLKDYGKVGEVYLTNCRITRHSLYGSIEVLSTSAVTKYVGTAQTCAEKLDYAGWGEDLFTESCLELLNVGHIEEFCLASDGCCGKKLVKGACSHRAPCTSGEVAFHPFKDEESYFRCLKQAQQ